MQINLLIIFMAIVVLQSCKDSTTPTTEKLETVTNNPAPQNWWNNATIYEVNLRQYTKEGTIKAFQSHLPRLEKMGIKILWLMPIYPIGEKNRKGGLGSYYSIQDYTAVNPDFGTKQDLDALIQDAHDRGIKVILDWVANHTAWDHPWTIDHPEWYSKDAQGNSPTVPFDDNDNPTDWTDVADLNFDNGLMRAAMKREMNYWLQKHDIDGFRCDMAHFVPLNFWSRAIVELRRTKEDIFMLAECETPDYINKGGFDANYGWEMHHALNAVAQGKSDVNKLVDVQNKVNHEYDSGAIKMNFITNHDENSWNGTVDERLGRAAQVSAIYSFTFDGIPLIYSGQERGLNKRLKFFEKDFIDWNGSNYEDFYSQLISLRTINPALWSSDEENKVRVLKAKNGLLVFERNKDYHQVIVALNFGAHPQSFKLHENSCAHTPYLSSIENAHFHANDEISLPANGYIVFASE